MCSLIFEQPSQVLGACTEGLVKGQLLQGQGLEYYEMCTVQLCGFELSVDVDRCCSVLANKRCGRFRMYLLRCYWLSLFG